MSVILGVILFFLLIIISLFLMVFLGVVFNHCLFIFLKLVGFVKNDSYKKSEDKKDSILDVSFPYLHYKKPLRLVKKNLDNLAPGYGYLFTVRNENTRDPLLTVSVVNILEIEDGLPKVVASFDNIGLARNVYGELDADRVFRYASNDLHADLMEAKLIRVAEKINNMIRIEFKGIIESRSEYLF